MSLPEPPSPPSIQPQASGNWGILLIASLGVLFCIGLTVLLISLRLEKALVTLTEERAALVGEQIRDSVEAGMRLGLRMADLSELPRQIKEQSAADAQVNGVYVYDDSGKLFISDSRDGHSRSLDPQLIKRFLVPAPQRAEPLERSWREENLQLFALQMRDPSSNPAGVVWVAYDGSEAMGSSKALALALSTRAAAVSGVVTLLAALAVFWALARWHSALQRVAQHIDDPHFSDRGLPELPGIPLHSAMQAVGATERELQAMDHALSAEIKAP